MSLAESSVVTDVRVYFIGTPAATASGSEHATATRQRLIFRLQPWSILLRH